MKFLISMLLVSSITFFSKNELSHSNLVDCSCSGLTCSCSATGCNSGGNTGGSCSCGLFSCDCACEAAQPILPTANGTQNENSVASQGYFEGLGTENGVTIAGHIQALRNAIANDDLEGYTENAPLLEEAFKKLPENEQNAYKNWVLKNLTPVKD